MSGSLPAFWRISLRRQRGFDPFGKPRSRRRPSSKEPHFPSVDCGECCDRLTGGPHAAGEKTPLWHLLNARVVRCDFHGLTCANRESQTTWQALEMSDGLISSQLEFDDFCDEIVDAGIVAYDTEFISENSYRPKLCLVQLAIPGRAVAVDPFEVDLTSWWDIMVDDETTIVVHSGKEETRFCLSYAQERPRQLVDVQIAEGLRGNSYPLSYERLISRVLGKSVQSTETRTDWQRRPLTERQIEYALDDVRYMLPCWEKQKAWLDKQGRLDWAYDEFERLIDDMEAERSDDSWTRLSGIRRLSARQLAVARELYLWRDSEAAARNQPIRRILRDDLLIDLARRQPQSEDELFNSRDMNRQGLRRVAPDIIDCVHRGLDLPKSQLPKPFEAQDSITEEPVLVKILAIALANRCAELDLSHGLVGSNGDLRNLVRWYSNKCPEDARPRLMTGWRAEVCGDLLRDVIDGKISLRVADPNSEYPLVFERVSRTR